MWHVVKIFDCSSSLYRLKLSTWSGNLDNGDTCILRKWYIDNVNSHGEVAKLLNYNHGRIMSWLDGVASTIVENAVRKVKGMCLLSNEKSSKVVSGWLPSLNPSVVYDLTFKGDFIESIRWISRVPMTSNVMKPLASFAASKFSHLQTKSNVRKKILSFWSDLRWNELNASNIRSIWLGIPRSEDLWSSSKRIVERCILVEDSIYLSIWENIHWLKNSTDLERQERWKELISNPESVLSHGIDQYTRLMSFLKLPIEDDLVLATEFMKKAKIRIWMPPNSFETPNRYISRVGSGWALNKDINDTKRILEWVKDVPMYTGYLKSYVDIPLDTPVLLKHPDDKMQWWSRMSYSNVHVGFSNVPNKYILGEAHRLSQEDWAMLSKQTAPQAIFGRMDMFDMSSRGHVFYDLCTKRCISQIDLPVCDNCTTLNYGDPVPKATQIFVSCEEDKKWCDYMTKGMNRIWLFNPRRIATRLGSATAMEADQMIVSCKGCKSANVVCCYESYQQVDVSILLVTKNTKPRDVYHVKSCTSSHVIFVEKDAGVPNLPYKPKMWNSLIHIQ